MNKEKTITFLIADCAVELVPPSLLMQPDVRRSLKRWKNAARILNVSYHKASMKKLDNPEKRGRPDILHHILLDLLNSPLNQKTKINIFFGTHLGEVHHAVSDLRVPKTLFRFNGLVYQLLTKKHVPADEPYLISSLKMTQTAFLKKKLAEDNLEIILLQATGKQIKGSTFLQKQVENEKDLLFVVGGFQKGEFSKSIQELNLNAVSIYPEPLEAWTVVNRLIVGLEIALDIF